MQRFAGHRASASPNESVGRQEWRYRFKDSAVNSADLVRLRLATIMRSKYL